MTTRFRCRSGHELVVDPSDVVDSQAAVCPLCGSVSVLKDAALPTKPGSFAATTDFDGSQFESKPAAGCPSHAQLNAYFAGELSEVENISVGDHLNACAECKKVVEQFDPPPETHLQHPRPAPSAGRTAPVGRAAALDTAPTKLAGHNIVGELGRGGMGIVYRAYDERNGRDVALKTMQRISPEHLQRFKREFRALADIAHPNLVSLYELLSDGKTWCFSMELLEGVQFLEFVWSGFEQIEKSDSREMVAETVNGGSRLSLRRLMRLQDALQQLAVGLHALHQSGRLHRDIKPSNVMVSTQQRLVMLDFGLVADAADLTGEQRMIMGTPEYMSPEQAAGEAMTEASDWYAVGVMLYEVLTGHLPVTGQPTEVMIKKQTETPVEPRQLQPGVPQELNDLCVRLLEIDPAKRPSAFDVLECVDAANVAQQLRAESRVDTRRSVDLVGREQHLAQLAQMFDEVAGGKTHSVFVHGRSGMGKSVLLQTFLEAVKADNKAVVLQGRCYEQESVPFKALDSLVDSLSEYFGSLEDSEAAELMPHDSLPLTRLFPVLGRFNEAAAVPQSTEVPEQQELRQRALDALRELFTKLALRQPVILYVDDLQWGDEDSAGMLADLVRPPDAPRLLLLGSYRSEDVGSSTSLQALDDAYNKGQDRPPRRDLAVESLSHEDSAKLALMLLGSEDEATKRYADRIARESGGWPFFVWELAHHVQDDASLAEGNLELDEVIWSRVSRLPQSTRRLLELFAVAGRPMRATEAYQAIDEVSDGPRLLAELRTNNFVRISDTDEQTVVETYHDRVRESVVNHLPHETVRRHYLSLAFVIEQTGGLKLDELAAHVRSTPDFEEPGEPYVLDKRKWQRVFDLASYYDAAGEHERTFSYALAAGEQAWSQNAAELAEQQFRIAERGAAGTTDALKFRVAEGLGDVLMYRGRYEAAEQQFNAARDLAVGNMALARIDGKLGALCFKKGEMSPAAAHIEKALKELGDKRPRTKFGLTCKLLKEVFVQVLHTYIPKWFVGRRRAGTAKCRRDLTKARLYDVLCHAYWFTEGPVANLWSHLRQMNLAERYPPSPEMALAYSFHAIVMTALPKAKRGVKYAEKSYRIWQDRGDLWGQGQARSFHTFSLLVLARFREGVETGREAVRLLDQAGDVWEGNMARMILSQPLYFLGDLRAAARELQVAYSIGIETGDYSAMAIAVAFLVQPAPHLVPKGAIKNEMEREREDPLSACCAIQARGLELLMCEDQPKEAAEVLQECLDLAKRLGFRNVCIISSVTWKATALRIVAEREPEGPARRRAIAEANKAVVAALKITKKYRPMRPQALRERAVVAVLQGNEKQARRFFDESQQVANEFGARQQQAQTLIARGEAGSKFGWPGIEKQIDEGRAILDEIENFEGI